MSTTDPGATEQTGAGATDQTSSGANDPTSAGANDQTGTSIGTGIAESAVPQPQTPLARAELDALLATCLEAPGLSVTDEQWECISAPMEPFVIVAGAGTGKTFVMAARVLWLVAGGFVEPHEVLGLTFTNKAAAQLATRVGRLLAGWRERPGAAFTGLGEGLGEPTITTYHSFAARILEEQGLRIGVEPGSRLLSRAAVAELAMGIVRSADEQRLAVNAAFAPSGLAGKVLDLDANLAEQAISTEDLRSHDREVVERIRVLPKKVKAVADISRTAQRRIELSWLVDELRARREEVGGLDFSDHMRRCLELVQSSAELVAVLRSHHRVVLLDEYQDTSITQRMILSTLFEGSAVTAVGDPLQAIYGWRSASVANIAAFGAHFGASRRQVLSVNRRSGEPILAAANLVAADLRADHPEVARLRAPGPRDAVLRTALLETVADECAWIVDQIAAEVQSGRPLGEIAVLARTNESLVPLHAALVGRGIPASISGSAPLTASPHAREVLATLRVLEDPADNTAMATLLAGPRWRLGSGDLQALGRRATELAGGDRRRGGKGPARPRLGEVLSDAVVLPDPVERPSLLEAAADPGPAVSEQARERLRAVVAELGVLHRRVGEPLPELVEAVMETLGVPVEAQLAGGRLAIPSAGERLRGLAQGQPGADQPSDPALAGLLQLVEGFRDAQGSIGLGAFLAHLEVAEDAGDEPVFELPALPGTVQLMTIHKAKGLEFPVVVLPHLSKGVFPASKGSDRWTTQPQVVPVELRDDRHVLPALTGFDTQARSSYEEQCRKHDRSGDDRLAYVAVTRAEDLLIASGHWWGPSQQRPRGPSPYLEALREQELAHCASDELLGPWTPAPTAKAGEDGDEVTNPMLEVLVEVPWPVPDLPREHPALRAADAVRALVASGTVHQPWQPPPEGRDGLAADDPVGRQVAAWDAAILALLARASETHQRSHVVTLPDHLSASAAMALAADPEGFAADLARPMPRPRSPHADLGTAFHAWVETRLGIQPLITDDDLPGAADEGIGSVADLAELQAAFERLPHADWTPVGLEVPFALPVGGRVLQGRIDAVFPAPPGAPPGVVFEVVDWKTSARDVADPLQLAIYRLAWARLRGIPVEQVGASFVFVRTGSVVAPPELPDLDALAAILAGQQSTPEATSKRQA